MRRKSSGLLNQSVQPLEESMNDNNQCGLYASTGQSVPLTAVHISGVLLGNTARITVAQTYRNASSGPVEAVYTFPLATGASVCAFEATVGDRQVAGQVMESEEAFERYDDAMADGHGAFLLDQQRPNIFTASVGNLEVGQEATVAISYVCKLEQDGPAVRFVLPTTIAPRYSPSTAAEVGQSDSEKVNPPKAAQVPYAFTVELDVRMLSSIASIESPSHAIRAELKDGSAKVTLASRDATMDRDFVLLVEERSPNQPGAALEERDGEYFAMVRMLPALDEIPAAGPQEIHFVLDCSGSMGGTSIGEAVRALELCVRALSEGDRFNIIPFGSTYRMLWPEPQEYSQETLDAAVEYVRACAANMGGTEILTPLEHILGQPVQDGVLRKVLLLTDGQVSNEADVIRLAQTHRDHTTVFTFGIGAGASEHLVRGIARASGGLAEFIYPGERIEPKVLRTFGRVRAPSLPEPRVSWTEQVELAPARLPRLYPSDVLTVFARSSTAFEGELQLTAGERSWSVDMNSFATVTTTAISTLWARHRIQDLENEVTRRGSNQRRSEGGDNPKKERVIELSKRFGVLCGHTSFVAVDIRSDADRTKDQAELRVVPIALTNGWGSGRRNPMSAQMARGAMVGAAPPRPMAAQPKSRGAFGRSRAVTPSAMPPQAMGPPVMATSAMAPRMDVMMDESSPAAGVQAEGEQRKSLRSIFKKASAPRRSPVAESAASISDPLYDVLLTQRANGSFTFGTELERLIGETNFAGLESSLGSAPDELIATAAVVHWLTTRASARRSEWATAVSKAEGWLTKQATFDVTCLLKT
ncbi:MAG: Ca-activated chloride channel family protein [Bradymonadia bacterium]|jgi:Ca-activated chloride channel family protein